MQTGRDQQTVDKAEDTGTQRPCGNDPLAARMDSVLHRRPDVAEERREDQTEEAGGDRHEAFAAEEAQEVRQLDAGPAIVHRPATRPVMIPASTPMLISGLMVTIALVITK